MNRGERDQISTRECHASGGAQLTSETGVLSATSQFLSAGFVAHPRCIPDASTTAVSHRRSRPADLDNPAFFALVLD
jgi:hypothetical protein